MFGTAQVHKLQECSPICAEKNEITARRSRFSGFRLEQKYD